MWHQNRKTRSQFRLFLQHHLHFQPLMTSVFMGHSNILKSKQEGQNQFTATLNFRKIVMI